MRRNRGDKYCRDREDEDRRPIAWRWHILNTHTDRFLPEDFPARAIPNYHVEYSHVPWILPRGKSE